MRVTVAKFAVVLLCLTLLSGCLHSEKTESRLVLTPAGGEIHVTYSGWKSDETDPEKIKKDFEDLVEKFATPQYEKDLSDQGIYLLDKKIYLRTDGKINSEYRGLVTQYALEHNLGLRRSNGERIFVQEMGMGAKVTSNGKILSTEKNTLIVWPESADTLTLSVVYDDVIKLKDTLLPLYKAWEKK